MAFLTVGLQFISKYWKGYVWLLRWGSKWVLSSSLPLKERRKKKQKNRETLHISLTSVRNMMMSG